MQIVFKYKTREERKEVIQRFLMMRSTVVDAILNGTINNELFPIGKKPKSRTNGWELLPKLTTNVECIIQSILYEIGMFDIRGLDYTMEAIRLVIENRELLRRVTTELYPTIAVKYNTTPSRVARGIRYAIEVAFNKVSKGEVEVGYDIFGDSRRKRKARPTNSEFIRLISKKISDL